MVHSNERLEFLGDAVLGWVVADLAYHRHGELAEGKLTDLRKSIVNASALAAVAQDLDIGAYLLLGKGEDAAGGRTKPSILSDAMEAVIGAVYIDGGTAAAYGLIERLVGDRLTSSASLLDHLDYKTALQELSARLFERAPVYVLREEGPDHAKHFFAIGRGGRSAARRGRRSLEEAGRAGRRPHGVRAARGRPPSTTTPSLPAAEATRRHARAARGRNGPPRPRGARRRSPDHRGRSRPRAHRPAHITRGARRRADRYDRCCRPAGGGSTSSARSTPAMR